MKEVELTGETIEDVVKKLRPHIGKELFETTECGKKLGIVILYDLDVEASRSLIYLRYIIGDDPRLFMFEYYPFDSDKFKGKIFLCIEEDEVFETFEEMARRKQEEMFHAKCY